MNSAAIIVVGNEILNGTTTDTNSGWMCRQVTGRGASVLQICTVPDEKPRIIRALKEARSLGAELLITLGGLGPTRDDLTVDAIAGFAGLPTEINPRALEIVNQRYRELKEDGRISDAANPEAQAAREKMGIFPQGGKALLNDVGAAPALYLDRGEYAVLALPGVPRELKSIAMNYAGSIFAKWLGSGAFRTASLVTSTNDESNLDGMLREFDKSSPEYVFLKSRARRFGQDVRMVITLSVRGASRGVVDESLRQGIDLVKTLLLSRNIQILEVNYDA